VKGNKIAVGEEFFQFNLQADNRIFYPWIVINNLQAKGLCNVASPLPDIAKTYHAKYFTRQFCHGCFGIAPIGRLLPFACRRCRGIPAHMIGQFQQQGKYMLRYGCRSIARHIAHRHSLLTGGFCIDNIVPGGKHTDQF